jgi:hypothetical protein
MCKKNSSQEQHIPTIVLQNKLLESPEWKQDVRHPPTNFGGKPLHYAGWMMCEWENNFSSQFCPIDNHDS